MDAYARLALSVATGDGRLNVEREVIQKCRGSFNKRKNQQAGG